MWTQSSQSLDFSKVVHLLNSVEMIFHALDGYIFASFDGLGFENF
jgi:hypothetical protein